MTDTVTLSPLLSFARKRRILSPDPSYCTPLLYSRSLLSAQNYKYSRQTTIRLCAVLVELPFDWIFPLRKED